VSEHPTSPPLGLRLARTAQAVSRAFDHALADAGGSLPMWLVLLNLKTRRIANQRDLASAVGIAEATLTHHLNAMEQQGLVTRRRDDRNRRSHLIALTDAGEQMFLSLRRSAARFDRRLRQQLDADDLAVVERALDQLLENVRPET
jgi:MarR family transcriptional regulator for hemolysin